MSKLRRQFCINYFRLYYVILNPYIDQFPAKTLKKVFLQYLVCLRCMKCEKVTCIYYCDIGICIIIHSFNVLLHRVENQYKAHFLIFDIFWITLVIQSILWCRYFLMKMGLQGTNDASDKVDFKSLMNHDENREDTSI